MKPVYILAGIVLLFTDMVTRILELLKYLFIPDILQGLNFLIGDMGVGLT